MLAEIMRNVEAGGFPPSDGKVEIIPAVSQRTSAVICFTGHIFVAADVGERWLRERVPDGDLSAAMNPPFLRALEDHLERRVNSVDIVFMASPLADPPTLDLREAPAFDHPRVRRAKRYRDAVQVWTTAGGVLTLGRGVAGRWEAAIEVDAAARGMGLGRRLATAARHLVPDGRPVWAQIASGNAASVRTFLGAGYVPVGSEALLVPVSSN